jgi:tetratricopeptide (TPR) repeat protein
MGSRSQTNLKGSARLGNYLRRLRTGYGYSLRRVEERARAEGGEIDNSQLSRYEKGVCYPSFDKLRVLSSVLNVPIQAFSDVVDLEAYEHLKPETGDPATLLEEGREALQAGDTPRAFACYERALEILEEQPRTAETALLAARTRIALALALHRLGKLSLAEQELRAALRSPEPLKDGPLMAQAILNLANVHADQGDLMLAEVEAEKALAEAERQRHVLLSARSLHTLGRVMAERGEHATAIERYRAAANLYERSGDTYEAIRIRLNSGGCYVMMGKVREGIRLLRTALGDARSGGYKRQQSHAWSYLGEAYYRLRDYERARKCLRESDTLASADEPYADLMFLNAFYDWKMAEKEDNPTREKIAFGRLKALRSGLERRFPEVEAFDAYVERGRRHA